MNTSSNGPLDRKPAAARLHKRAAANGAPQENEISQDEIATLAYSFWEARGYQGGSPEEDWLRAEEQLRERTLAATA